LNGIDGRLESNHISPITIQPTCEYLNQLSALPPGSIVGISSVYKNSPTMAALLGRGRSPFTDLIFNLPFIPCMHYGEIECLTDRMDTMDRFIVSVSSRSSTPPLPGDTGDISPRSHELNSVAPVLLSHNVPSISPPILSDEIEVGHELGVPMELDPINSAAHFALMLKVHKILMNGDQMGWSVFSTTDPQVIAIIRRRMYQKRQKIFVCLVNFSNHESVVHVGGFFNETDASGFAIESDLLQTGSTIPWAIEELVESKLQVMVPRFSSVYRVFKIYRPDDDHIGGSIKSKLIRASMKRKGVYIKRLIQSAVASENFCQLKILLGALAPNTDEAGYFISQLVSVGELDSEATNRLVAKISKLPNTSQIIDKSNIGIIMFTTPELGQWSTFGGLGVMVDDLVNTMAQLRHPQAVDVPLIWVCSPYYERNRKGEKGYLESGFY
jgi:hypothetical protein